MYVYIIKCNNISMYEFLMNFIFWFAVWDPLAAPSVNFAYFRDKTDLLLQLTLAFLLTLYK